MRLPVDLHIHSCLSPCGDDAMTPGNIVRMAVVKELAVIAITDHNACRNVPAAQQVAQEYGLCVVPGVEVTTTEDIHTLCYFPEYAPLLDFCQWLDDTALPIRNKPHIFGRQLVIDAEDRVLEEREILLLPGRGGSIDVIEEEAWARGGVMVPAHINKQANSLLAILGSIPPDLKAMTMEVFGEEDLSGILGDRAAVRSSDAHQLEDILEPVHCVSLEKATPGEVVKALRRGTLL